MKNNYLLKVLFTLFLCGSFSMSDAAVYSISVAGNDVSGTGSALSPWASFSMAQTAAASGDTIQVSGMIDMWSDPANLTFASILPAGSFSTTNKTGILITKSLTIQGTSSAMDGFDGKSNLDGTNTTRLFQLSDPLVTLTLKNLKLVNGAAKTDITTVSSGGGAILMLNGNIVAENVLFDSNLAVGHSALAGAVLYITNTNALGTTFKNCVFSNNAADKTGAIYINALAAGTASAPSVLKFEGCSFIANESRLAFGGSAIFLRLGSVYTTVSMINCTIAKNKVSVAANGGAVYLYSGKISTVVNLINCTITENTAAGSAGNGAGVYFPNNVSACQATLNIQNSIIEGNTAAGGVYSDINIYATPPVPGTTPVTYSAGPPVVGTTGFLSVNNSIVGRNGSTATIPTGCIGANSSFGYLTSTSSSNALKAGLAPFDATNNVYPLYTGSLAINYGASTYLTTLLPPVTTDQLNNVRTVGATNHAGAVETATVATTTPSAPTSLVATSTAFFGQVSVAFKTGATGGSLVTNYKYSLNDGPYVACDPAKTTSPIVISGLINDASYTIKIKAVNANGEGVESVASNSVIPTGTTGLDNVTNTLSIYKNANNQLVVTNASLKTGTISIYNAVGQRVCNTVINGISTTIHKTFNAGVYLILVKSDGKTNSTKVIF